MNFLFKASKTLRPTMSLYSMPMRSYYYPEHHHHHLQEEPHLIVKRVINAVGQRLREIDSH